MKEKILNFFKRKDHKKERIEEVAVTVDGEEVEVITEGPTEQKPTDLKEELSLLMGKSIQELEEEFVLYNVKKYFSHVGSAVVKTETFGDDIKLVFKSCNQSMFGSVLISSVNLESGAKLIKKKVKKNFSIGTIIDYPFGESAVTSRMSEAKESNKAQMDFAILTLPIALLNAENEKDLKKQVKKFSKCFKKEKGVAISILNLSESVVKRLGKVLAKNKIERIVLVFGEEQTQEIVQKIQQYLHVLGEKRLSLIANVKKAQDVTALINIGVESVFTPFADEIYKEVQKRFSI